MYKNGIEPKQRIVPIKPITGDGQPRPPKELPGFNKSISSKNHSSNPITNRIMLIIVPRFRFIFI